MACETGDGGVEQFGGLVVTKNCSPNKAHNAQGATSRNSRLEPPIVPGAACFFVIHIGGSPVCDSMRSSKTERLVHTLSSLSYLYLVGGHDTWRYSADANIHNGTSRGYGRPSAAVALLLPHMVRPKAYSARLYRFRVLGSAAWLEGIASLHMRPQ